MTDTTTTPFAPATASRLVGAYVIDLALLGVLLAVTWFVYFTPLTIGLITAEAVVASAIMLGANGRTPGMAAMRVCLIRDEDDAQTPSLGSALAYTAMSVGLQLTIVGPLAALAMVSDGHTWLTGPTRTRLVDLRKHAALAAGPAAGAGEGVGRPRPGQAPSGFDSVHTSPVSQDWAAPTAPLTPVPSRPDYSAPGSRANDPNGPGYSVPQPGPAPAVPPGAPAPAAPAAPSYGGPGAAPGVPPAPAASAPAYARAGEATQFDDVLTTGSGSPVPERSAAPAPSASAAGVPPAPAATTGPRAPMPPPGVQASTPAEADWGAPGSQTRAQAPRASHGTGEGAGQAAGAYASTASGVPAPPPSRRAFQAAQSGAPGRSQWGGGPAVPAPTPLLWLIFDSGQRELIDSPLTLGRAPASVEGSRAVVVPDTTVSLSRTHMRVGPTASGAWIEDSFSANGTQIRTPDGRITALAGGQAVEVPAGTEILMGERRATIVYADADSVH